MPRVQNKIVTKRITLATTSEVIKILDLLVHKGLYGKTQPEVAEELLRRTLREIVNDEALDLGNDGSGR